MAVRLLTPARKIIPNSKSRLLPAIMMAIVLRGNISQSLGIQSLEDTSLNEQDHTICSAKRRRS